MVRAGVEPVVVPASRVRHLGSRTGRSLPDELTWGQVALYERKYGAYRLRDDRRYRLYQRRLKAMAR